MRNPFKAPKKNKQQIAQEAHMIEEARRGKKIVKDVLYPILHEHATSINNAEHLVQIFKVIIVQQMQKPFKDKTIGELDFKEELENEKDEKSKKIFESFVDGFKGISIADAVKILDGFEQGVQAYFQRESRTREFKSLKLEDLIGKES